MKKTIIAFAFMFLFIGTTHAVSYSSVFLSKSENQYFGSIASCIKITPLTERIEQDRLGASTQKRVLMNLERMIQSAEVGCGFQMPKLQDAITRVNEAVNLGVRIPVFGRSAKVMNYFTEQGFRFAGE